MVPSASDAAKRSAADIEVFDCNQRLGAMPYGKMSVIPDGMDLFGEEALERRRTNMATVGIDATLINPVWYYDRPNGAADTSAVNDRLAAVCAAAPDLLVGALGLAEPLHGQAGLDEIRRLDEELGFVGVFYANTWQGVTVLDDHMYAHLEMLQERRMLVLLHMPADSMAITPPMVAELAASLPELPMVLLDWGSSMQHSAQLLLDAGRYPNLYLDTSGVIPIMIRKFVDANGPERLVYGSDMYSHTAGTHNSPALIRQLLTPAEARSVLRDNLLRLLEWTGRKVVTP